MQRQKDTDFPSLEKLPNKAMRELNNIYKHIFLYVYAPYEKSEKGERITEANTF